MATDWAADVKKYVTNADDAAIAGLVRYCGIALRNRDSALVSFSDKAETDRVRNNFLKKKLALSQPDSVLDAAIAKVGEQMKADRTKNRVTVYYLLASEFKQLGLFVKSAPAAKAAPATKTPAAAAAAAKAAVKAPTRTAAKPATAKAAAVKAAPAKPAVTKAAAKPASTPAAKVVGAAALAAGAAAAVKAKPAAKKVAATAKAVPAKAAAPAKATTPKIAAPKAATAKVSAPKVTTAKAAAPASNAAQGLLDKAASTASDAGKATSGAVTGAVTGAVAGVGALGAAALSAASGAAATIKEGAVKATDTASSAVSSAAGQAGAKMSSTLDPAGAASAKAGDDSSDLGWWPWLLGAALAALIIWFVFFRGGPDTDDATVAEGAASAAASDVGTDLAAAPSEGLAQIPVGAGVTSEMRDGKPVVKVYFDSGKTDVTPEFTKTAGGLKSWLNDHSGSVLAISGYSDPTGNAAANAELSKQRAQSVQAALGVAGIPATTAALVKPEVSADASVPKDAARRVEVVVK